MTTIAIAGNPNCGKSALFNCLTGIRQTTGNWPGVTVERKQGSMILAELKEFVRQRGQVSLGDAALHFDIEPDAVRGMLEFWINKGRISKKDQACAGGCACSFADQGEIYFWNPQLGRISIESQ